ncbi:hypothetical protein ACQ33O_13035 [Ferruginibacter sp. SUN002]|uniref:hypothetical protein n=1 Tax=Ferruginibacter sp. SUN002 TaxID=2937789 RepID=UPI003D36F07F
MEQQTNLLENDLIIDTASITHLKETAMWAKFLGVVGFVMSGIIAVMALAMGTLFSKLTGSYSGAGDLGVAAGGSIMMVYLVMAAITFFMSRFLFLFARKTQVALKTSDQESLVTAFKNLKVYFRFAGIITIIGLVFFVLALVVVLMAASFSRY